MDAVTRLGDPGKPAGGGRTEGAARTLSRRAGLPLLVAVVLPAGGLGCATPATRAAPAAPAALPEDLRFVIPAGTSAAQMRGEPAFTLPDVIDVVVGQAIAVQNDDSAMHYFFSIPIAPGQTVRKRFDQAGQFGYSTILSCSVARTETLTVRVSSPQVSRRYAGKPPGR